MTRIQYLATQMEDDMATYRVEYTRKLRDGRERFIELETMHLHSAQECFQSAKLLKNVIWARYYQIGVEGDIAEYYAQ